MIFFFLFSFVFSNERDSGAQTGEAQTEIKKCDFSKLKLPPQCIIKKDGGYDYPFVMIECENTFSKTDWCKKNKNSPACKLKRTKIFSAPCKSDGTFKENIGFSNIFGKLVGFSIPQECSTPRFENGYISLECSDSKGGDGKELYKTPLFYSPFFKFKQTPYFLNLNGLTQIYIPENCSADDLNYTQGELKFSCLNADKSLKSHSLSVQFEKNDFRLVTTIFEKNETDFLMVWHPYECLITKRHKGSDLYVSCEPDQDVNIKASDPDELIKERRFFQLFTSEMAGQLLVTKTQDQRYQFFDVPLTCSASSVVIDDKKIKISCYRNTDELKNKGTKMSLEMLMPSTFLSQNICQLRQMEDQNKHIRLSAPCNRGSLSHLLPQGCLSKYMRLEDNMLTVSCYDKSKVAVQNNVPVICDCSGNPIDSNFSLNENGVLILKKSMGVS